MKSLPCFIVCLCIFLCCEDSARGLQDSEDEGAFLSCKCGKSMKEWKKPLKLSMAEDIFKHVIKSGMEITSYIFYPNVIRYYLKQCSSCEIIFTKCTGHPDVKDDYHCEKNSIGFVTSKNETYNFQYKDLLKFVTEKLPVLDLQKEGRTVVHITKRSTELYPVHVHIPVGGLKKRYGRQITECHYPTSLQTAQLDCTHYPSGVKCTQKCAFGYRLKNGHQMDYKCKNKEGRWYPENFKECEPFIDCTVTLVSGGSSRCTSPTLKKGPVCDIKCDKYEDMPSIGSKKYSCDIRGEWTPKLPFCVNAGSGLEVVPAP